MLTKTASKAAARSSVAVRSVSGKAATVVAPPSTSSTTSAKPALTGRECEHRAEGPRTLRL